MNGNLIEDGNHGVHKEGTYAAILKNRSHVLSKIDAETLSHPPVRSTTNNDVLIKIPRKTHARIKAVWRFSLVGRLIFFKTLKFEDVKKELLNQRKLSGSVQFIPWKKGYFVIKLDNEDDRKRVSYDGPWKIKSETGFQQLKIHPWTPMFDPGKDKITRAAVWFRFTALPMEFWDEETIFRMARGLGKPVSVDPRTLHHEYGYFAAALIDIDFSQPLGRILIDGEENEEIFVQDYEILNRPNFCDYCKSIGHKKSDYRTKKYDDLKDKADEETDPEIKKIN